MAGKKGQEYEFKEIDWRDNRFIVFTLHDGRRIPVPIEVAIAIATGNWSAETIHLKDKSQVGGKITVGNTVIKLS